MYVQCYQKGLADFLKTSRGVVHRTDLPSLSIFLERLCRRDPCSCRGVLHDRTRHPHGVRSTPASQ